MFTTPRKQPTISPRVRRLSRAVSETRQSKRGFLGLSPVQWHVHPLHHENDHAHARASASARGDAEATAVKMSRRTCKARKQV